MVTLNSYSQNTNLFLEMSIDERVELTSIVFRLAGSNAYNSNSFPKYEERIDKYFSKYKHHKLINYVKNNLLKHSIDYDAVMFMAIHITEPPEMKEIIPFSDKIPDYRWNEKRGKKFLILLNQFYTDTKFKVFFEENKDLYKITKERFNEILKKIDIGWYEKFYGQTLNGQYKIIINLCGGYGGYGPKITMPNGTETIYAILGIWQTDSIGLPIFEAKEYTPILLHEINHSFVNHIIEKHKKEFENSGKIIFQKLKDKMSRIGYDNWKTMYDEAVVRASVIKYMKDHKFNDSLIRKEINFQLNSGFVFIESLVEKLEKLDSLRTKYPTFENYIPELVNFFNQTASNIDTLIKKVELKRPKVISIIPFNNNAINVDYTIKQISIKFNKPLNGKGYSIYYGSKGKSTFPKINKVYYSKDKKTLFLNVELIPNKEYQFLLKDKGFISQDGFNINDYEINFKTKSEI